MSSDFEGYEQDFAVLTAEITNKIARVPRLPPDEKKQMVANVEKQLEEAKELLEQMDLEVREIPPQSRGMYSNRMRSYKQEMGKLETDFKRSRIAYSDEVRNELLGDDGNSSENQRAHLLDNTERLERSSRRLEAGYQIAVETVLGLTLRSDSTVFAKIANNKKCPEHAVKGPALGSSSCLCDLKQVMGFPGGSVAENLPANAGEPGDVITVLGLGRSPRGGNGNPNQYSC
ncbi:vesicle transport through interaction with t-SNAREs homolog 1A isoform X9 [Bubalus kerabau]|uniref:vesicle transport through interaction with t-SNAREs homolog 1A isoform X9 n=1 Tax=Bubalus carabanensis TaxID=3119969 RepID=UPI00244EA354|nr:vesicle transport through interaction with t-SNAREs homolog 1A isoform X9 [Bubalus carabanensis]